VHPGGLSQDHNFFGSVWFFFFQGRVGAVGARKISLSSLVAAEFSFLA
jgi:hypothetical protein